MEQDRTHFQPDVVGGGGAADVTSQQPAPDPVQQYHAAVPHTIASPDAVTTSPMPVVRVLSPVGVEYVFLTIALFTGAIGVISVLIALVNSKTDFTVLAFPVSLLVVAVPIFAALFLHVKKQELSRPELKLDPSKRRSTQFTQIAAFVVCFGTLIGLVGDIFSNLAGDASITIVKAVLDAACILVVAGGILAYYWHDEHKVRP